MNDEKTINLAIVGVVVAIGIMTVVGIHLVDSFGIASDVSNTESYGVSDPNTDKTCILEYDAVSGTETVQYYNGTSWKTLASGDYTLSGDTLVVSDSAMD
jgi:hypothetical protein